MALTPASVQTHDISHDESQDYLWTLNFGPQHPATHTTLRIVLKLDGERVVEAMPDIGYLHSGFEKLGESLDYNQYVTVTDRMNYISPMANNVAWHGAVEKLLGIELTPRCKYIRVIVCGAGPHQRPPAVQRGRWGSTPAPSPSSYTPSIAAKRSTTSSRRCAAPASRTATRASAG